MDTRQAQKPCLRIKIRRNVLLGILATGFCTTLNSNQLGPISKQKLGFSALSWVLGIDLSCWKIKGEDPESLKSSFSDCYLKWGRFVLTYIYKDKNSDKPEDEKQLIRR